MLGLAAEHFIRLVESVETNQWSLPTPCEEWDVGALVDHVVGGNWFTAAILDGAAADSAMQSARSRFDTATDRKAAALGSFTEQAHGFRNAGVLERICHHVIGDIPGSLVLRLRVTDITIHGWDLARGIGADDTIPDVLVEAVWADVCNNTEALAVSGRFGSGSSNDLPDGADLQTRLLDATGRRP